MVRIPSLAAIALMLVSGAAVMSGPAFADDAMKSDAGGMTKSDDGMMKTGAMKTDSGATAECKEKAGMETDQMKKDEAMKACDAMGMKPAQ